MTKTVTATQARVRFGELLREVVEKGETVLVERSGKPQVVVVSVERYQQLCAGQAAEEDWWDQVLRTRERIRQSRGDRPMPDITQLIHEMREERDAQLLDNLLRR